MHVSLKTTAKMTTSTERSNSFSDFISTAPEQRDGVPFVLTPPSSEILKDAQVSQQKIFLSKSRAKHEALAINLSHHISPFICISNAICTT